MSLLAHLDSLPKHEDQFSFKLTEIPSSQHSNRMSPGKQPLKK